MPEKRYWGPSNQYGPYSVQADGWPNAGEVVRDYRKRVRKWSANTLAKMYGEAIGNPSITGRWIQRMEKLNLVPSDVTRRRALASILGIPLGLLGLGTLEEVQPRVYHEMPLAQKQLDVSAHTQFLDLYWKLDHASTAQTSLPEMEKITAQLRAEARASSGKSRDQVLELLCGYYTLISTVYTDQCRFDLAYKYADDAVTLASNMQNNKLLAVSLYQRGYVRQQRGTWNGTLNVSTLQSAIDDYNAAIPIATPRVQIGVYMDIGLVQAYLKRTATADQALKSAGLLLDRNLNEGTFIDEFANVDKGRYRLGQAAVFTALKRFDDANDLLFEAKESMNQSQTRRVAWAEAIEAQIYYGQRNYALATATALQSLKIAKSIKTQTVIQMITALHHQLMTTSYRGAQPMNQLGAELILP